MTGRARLRLFCSTLRGIYVFEARYNTQSNQICLVYRLVLTLRMHPLGNREHILAGTFVAGELQDDDLGGSLFIHWHLAVCLHGRNRMAQGRGWR